MATWTDLGAVPVIAASPTTNGRKVAQLHKWDGLGGKLVLGYGDWQNTSQPGCDLVMLDLATDAISIYVDPANGQPVHTATDAFWSHRTVDCDLWAIVTDPEVGADPDAVIVTPRGVVSSITGGLSPYSYHQFDAISWGGRKFIAGADRTAGFEGAAIWRSNVRSDGLTQWVRVFSNTAQNTLRVYSLFALERTLYGVVSNGNLIQTTNGTTWTVVSGQSFPAVTTKPQTIHISGVLNVVYRSGWPALATGTLYRWSGSGGPVTVQANTQDHFIDGNDLWVMTVGAITKNGSVQATPPAGAVSLAVDAGRLYVGTADSRVWKFA